jgi:hypothetical protein
MSDHKTDIIKVVGDVAAGGVSVATLMQWLPAVAAIFTIVWTAMRLYESVTGKAFSQSGLAKLMRGERS